MCTSDPGCSQVGPRCDPSGSNRLGTCVDVGAGCLKFRDAVACPSTLQVCPVGQAACACTGTQCVAGVDKACASNGTLVTCALDVPGGCAVYPQTGLVCLPPSVCSGAAPDASCCPAAGTSEGSGCSTVGATACDGAKVLTCAARNGCTVWTATQTCTEGLTCAVRSGTATCACPANQGTDFYADALAGSAATEAPFPTGVDSPAACRYRRVTDALAAATNAARGGTSAQVLMTGRQTGPMRFRNETFPLVVPAFVNLTTTDNPASAANYIIELNASLEAVATNGGAAFVVRGSMGSRSLVSGFTVQNRTGFMRPVPAALEVPSDCVGAALELRDLAFDLSSASLSAAEISTGLDLDGRCTQTLERVDIKGAPYACLALASASSDPGARGHTTVRGGAIEGCAFGVLMSSGTASFTGADIRNHTIAGVSVAATGPVDLTLGQGTQVRGALVGLDVPLPTTTQTIAVRLDGASLHGNRDAAATLACGTGASFALTRADVRQNGDGVSITSSATSCPVTVVGGTFTENGGVAGSRGALYLTGALSASLRENIAIQANLSAGLVVTSGASATLSGGVLKDNAGFGALVSGGGDLRIENGASVKGNGALAAQAAGIRVEAATLTLDGQTSAVVIEDNAKGGAALGPGVQVALGAARLPRVTSTRAVFRRNGGAGVRVDVRGNALTSDSAATLFSCNTCTFERNLFGLDVASNVGGVGHGIEVRGSTFDGNTTAGIIVRAAAPPAAGGQSLGVYSNRITGGTSGIVIAPSLSGGTPEAVTANFDGNLVAAASATGVTFNASPSSSVIFNGNYIAANNTSNAQAGGVLLVGTQPRGWSFAGNVVARNGGHQLVATTDSTAGTARATWRIGPGNGCTSPNQLCGYAAGAVGLFAQNADVNATSNYWQSLDPVPGIDTLTQNGSVLAAPDCAVTTPAPCP